jgi:uncharacterized repeat protein (TIGR01451 family)
VRRLGLVLSLGAVAALAIAGATSARVDVGEAGTASAFAGATNDGPKKVFVCKYVGTPGVDERLQTGDNPINVSINAIPDGASVGSYFADDQGRSFVLAFDTGQPEPPASSCPPPAPDDVCPNIDGVQESVPQGMIKDGQGNCVPPPPVDVCPNIHGDQATVPEGYTLVHGECVIVPPPVDVCPNIHGDQATVPGGLVKNEHGDCVTPPAPPPPPPPPTVKSDEFMDVQVVKDATPQVQLVNGQADIAYTVRVRNNGPNQAHNVTLVDAAPSGVTFLAVTLQPVGGNCTTTASLLSCTLGTLGPGVERTIGLSARVTQTGTYVNSATGTGEGKDTNGVNNTDDASTLVTAPVTPPTTTPKPTPKPKPKPTPDICRVLKVTPSMVKANGRGQLVVATVTRSRNPVKGVAVRFAGAGTTKVVRTNAKGVARFTARPGKAGILLVKITSAKACNSARIGVVGVFEPPVAG